MVLSMLFIFYRYEWLFVVRRGTVPFFHDDVIKDLSGFRVKVDARNETDHRIIFKTVEVGTLIF